MNAKESALWKVIALLSLCGLSAGRAQTNYENYTFTRFAGPQEVPGWHDGTGGEARFSGPHKIAVDSSGNVFVADFSNHTIRKITVSGLVTTVAGQAFNPGATDGLGRAARFNNPAAIVVDGSGNLYVADYGSHTIRKVSPAGQVTTLAGAVGLPGSANGTASAARFNQPIGLTLDNSGNLYVADSGNHTIRKITADGKVTTLAGLAGAYGFVNGTGAAARFIYPFGITFADDGNFYVSEVGTHTIRKITPGGVVTTLAGSPDVSGSADGTGSSARFNQPFDIGRGPGKLFVADTYNQAIREVTYAGVVTTAAGSAGRLGSDDGIGSAARFAYPAGVGSDLNGNIYVADYSNNSIRRIDLAGNVSTLAGTSGTGSANGSADVARFNYPAGVIAGRNGVFYIADFSNHTIRKVAESGMVSTLAGRVGVAGSADGLGSTALFRNPVGLASDTDGNVFVSDYGNHTIRKITPEGEVTTLAGLAGTLGSADGAGAAARFYSPFFITMGNDGNLFVADTWNHIIRSITPEGSVTTLAGMPGSSGSADGNGSTARFSYPEGIAADSEGNLFVADSANQVIRKVTPAGEVTTIAGAVGVAGGVDGVGAAARFSNPFGVAVDLLGNVFVTDYGSSTIRKINPDRVVTTLAGTQGRRGHADGSGNAALFSGLEGIALDGSGALYVADSSNHAIRKGTPSLPDRAVVNIPRGAIGAVRQLSVSNLTTTSWAWRIVRQPATSTAQLSSTNGPDPTLIPDVPDLFVIRFTGLDAMGRVAINDVSIEAGAPDVLSLSISGQGSVSPDLRNSKLVIGKTYTVTAKPVKGFIFAGWTGDAEASNSKLTFTMGEYLTFEAKFIPDPFPAVAGTYQGLFFEEGHVTHQSSGFITAKISTKGSLSAKILSGGKSYSLSGPISPTGAFVKSIARAGLSPLMVQLQVDFVGAELLTGQVSDGNWTANLIADRNVYSPFAPATPVGKFTFVIPGTTGAPGLPGGHGVATVTTDAAGNVKLAGNLGDTTKISQKSIRSRQGKWPFYVSLYSGNGSILGWLSVQNNSITNSNGPVSWIKLPQPAAKLYPAGFTNEANVIGSRLNLTNGVPLVPFANGQIQFKGGNLASDFSNQVAAANNKFTNLSGNKLTLSVTTSSGLLKGTVVDPVTAKSFPFSGVWLQNSATGYGYFSGVTQTGGFILRATP